MDTPDSTKAVKGSPVSKFTPNKTIKGKYNLGPDTSKMSSTPTPALKEAMRGKKSMDYSFGIDRKTGGKSVPKQRASRVKTKFVVAPDSEEDSTASPEDIKAKVVHPQTGGKTLERIMAARDADAAAAALKEESDQEGGVSIMGTVDDSDDVFSPAVGARSSTKGNLFGQKFQVDDDDDEEYETEDDDAPDAVEDSHRLKTTKLADEVVRVGPFHPSVPQAMNKMWKERNKAHSGKDPNGRSKGRSLIMWHRPRMMEKLIHCIQYECHIQGVRLPWDEIAHRFKPGASGPAVIQHLNRIRDQLIQEGHMTPPNMGKSLAVKDETVRGYVRDMRQPIPTVCRKLGWNEVYEDRKKNLEDPGWVKGSGTYDRNKENRVAPLKETGRRNRVPVDVQQVMAVNRTKKRYQKRSRGKGAAVKEGNDSENEDVGVDLVKVKRELTDSPPTKIEADLADLASDEDYHPDVTTSSNKRKSRGRSSVVRKKMRRASKFASVESENDDTDIDVVTPIVRKKTRRAAKALSAEFVNSDSDNDVVTPVRQTATDSTTRASIETPGTIGTRALAKLNFETPTKTVKTPAKLPPSRIWPVEPTSSSSRSSTVENEVEDQPMSNHGVKSDAGYVTGDETEEDEVQASRDASPLEGVTVHPDYQNGQIPTYNPAHPDYHQNGSQLRNTGNYQQDAASNVVYGGQNFVGQDSSGQNSTGNFQTTQMATQQPGLGARLAANFGMGTQGQNRTPFSNGPASGVGQQVAHAGAWDAAEYSNPISDNSYNHGGEGMQFRGSFVGGGMSVGAAPFQPTGYGMPYTQNYQSTNGLPLAPYGNFSGYNNGGYNFQGQGLSNIDNYGPTAQGVSMSAFDYAGFKGGGTGGSTGGGTESGPGDSTGGDPGTNGGGGGNTQVQNNAAEENVAEESVDDPMEYDYNGAYSEFVDEGY